MKTYEKQVIDFKTLFYNLNNRYPMDNEIIDNLKEKIELDTLKKIIVTINKKANLTVNIEEGNIHDSKNVNSPSSLIDVSIV